MNKWFWFKTGVKDSFSEGAYLNALHEFWFTTGLFRLTSVSNQSFGRVLAKGFGFKRSLKRNFSVTSLFYAN